MAISGPAKIGFAIGAVAFLAILAVSVVTLVKVFNIKTSSTQVQPDESQQNELNIYPHPVANTQAYQQASQYFAKSIDTSVNPCDDFYQYACGNYNNTISFDVADNDNYNIMADAFSTFTMNDPTPIMQVKKMYAQCVSDRNNWNNVTGDGEIIKSKVDAFAKLTGFGFPFVDGSNRSWPDPVALGTALGYLSGVEGTDTLISAVVDTNWRDPTGPSPYLLYIDQSVLTLPWTYYIGKTWDTTKDILHDQIQQLLAGYANITGVQYNDKSLEQDIKSILDFEYLLANNYSTSDDTRLDSLRSYNLITPTSFAGQYKNIDITNYLKQLTTTSKNASDLVTKTTFAFSLAEPERLAQINDAVTNSFGGAVSPRTFYNYLYYRLLSKNTDYFPDTITSDEFLNMYQVQHSPRGRKKFIKKRRTTPIETSDSDLIVFNCVDDTVGYLQYANARVFIDKIYPDNNSRVNLRESVRKVVEGILIGMQSMIDQLDWMTPASKQGAYQKIQNLVRNYAYPDFITDNQQLYAYYKDLPDFTDLNYYEILSAIQTFNMKISYDLLSKTDGVDRSDWNGPPGTVNAWYQPELNSITFPAAILRQPYFDPEWPASINYGAFGVVAGHELTHSFDSSGTQWDGIGMLSGWLDSSSQKSFNDMVSCVINEYNNFCPLNASYSPRCINGKQTQGENVADNGGIHSAYRAYRNAINFDGSNPLLPGDPINLFTHDQLFFLSFAQVWCENPLPPDEIYRALLIDPHSPAKYRVFGTIQNYPGFRNAYNCPVGATYAPEKHCNVWISDINITDTNSGSGSLNTLNIQPAEIVKQDNPQYTKYSQAQQFFKNSVNTSFDPCNDFYNYACGNYNDSLSFSVYRNRNYDLMAKEFETILSPDYNGNILNSTAIQKITKFYSECKKTVADLNNNVKDGKFVKSVLDEFMTYTGWTFNWFDNSTVNSVNRTTLAKAMAFLSIKYSVDTFITPVIDINPKNDSKFKGFVLYYDQGTFLYANSYYLPGTWDITRPKYQKNAKILLTNYGNSIGVNVDANLLEARVSEMITFEQTIANDPYVANDTIRRNFSTLWTPTNISTLNMTIDDIDWFIYTSELQSLSKVQFIENNDVNGYYVSVMEPGPIRRLGYELSNTTADIIVRYLSFRLLASLQSFVYNPNSTTVAFQRVYPKEGLQYHIGLRQPSPDPFEPKADAAAVQRTCAIQSMNFMQYANARVFTEYLYPDDNARKAIRNSTGLVMSAIKNAMQSMLDELDWLDRESQQGARAKIENLEVNIAYPDFILNNDLLDDYYSNLAFDNNDDYFLIVQKLIFFNRYIQFVNLIQTEINRNDFLGPPGTVNAWYQPELNSITIPEGILQQPYFDPDWPASIKFGALGVILGHELGHAFDDEGVQWTGLGQLEKWMTDGSYKSFLDMAQCVIDEYSNFKPLNDTYNPNHLNGVNTQGENIADNGGIHSGWRSYRNWISLNGPDPQLPDRTISQFTHDQLFFLSFAQVWCQLPPSPDNIYTQILVDPHSPSLYRVLGTLQNFPAFRSSFNCPLNSVYAPEKHCHVWVP